ncbi:MAG: BsuPI-related putative proteinase inhibitor [Eubacteriales bacterium]
MKKSFLGKTIFLGSLCSLLVIPSFAQDVEPRLIDEDSEINPIRHEIGHWAEPYVNQLSSSFDVKNVFEETDLNNAITESDFKELVKLIIDEDYDGSPDSLTREAIVYELTKIWAEKTDKDLEEIAVIQMLIYSDTVDIDLKYKHAVTVAYMMDIAKGRDTGVFDPQAEVTYGEMATLINNTNNAIGKEVNVNNESIVEGKFETKGDYEIKDDKVIFDFELINQYTQAMELQFGSGQQFEIVITDEKDEEVYRFSDGKFFTLAIVFENLEPGESLKWQDEWDMTNKDGEKLTSGDYKAEINIMVTEDSVKLDKDQFSTVIDFSL